jgi:cytochrome oxidase Cu insertion factor (SCO1/SenC/PrrC family)
MKPAWSIAASLMAAFLVAVCCVCPAARAQQISAPNERFTLGRAVPQAWFLDEHGDTLLLSDLAGKPLILSPVFTTCPHACPAITSGLAEALHGVGGCGKTFNVLTLSFDPGDSPDDLRAYRQRTEMPKEWILATGVPEQVKPVMDAIDFRYEALPGGGFAHANTIVILTPDLTISGYLHGLMYTADEVKAALRKASGRRPLIDRARPFLLPISAVFLIAALIVIIATRRRHHPAP